MTRQEAYVAELSQLLFYMTPWDKAAALKDVNKKFAETENEAELLNELGSPMKLAVTLNRSYVATPEPTAEELAAREAAEAAAEEVVAEEAVEESVAEEATEEVVAEEAVEEPVAEEATEEVAAEEAVEEPVAEEATEEVAAEEAAEEPVVEEAAEEATAETVLEQLEEIAEAVEEAVEELMESVEDAVESILDSDEEDEEDDEEGSAQTPWVIEENPEQEKIFAEIFNAATEAQTAVVLEEEPKKTTVRKARYFLLIPYTILALLIGIPGTALFAVANVAVVATSVVCLVSMVYLVIFHLFAAVGLATQLIILGLAVVMLALSLILGVFALWFLYNATLGVPRALREFAAKHCYREVEVK